ncbi:NYN domain-containing protein [Candidatus Enterovibrio escicola]|uniref:NYN domain-containing protein n=1 Tax=Candidatus Enterovibrio escicola TaxID=1927127 RepID=A0A2A5SZC2_9GAMM|nr:NYN domain-containing protein [Candidatus Enterovibrio escacola]PCS21230.1 hypothetical protein BTN49_3118 [Candidatus Enterovibrio escacola]
MKKIAVFADVQNVYYTTRQVYGRQFNYHLFWKKLAEIGEVVYATAYAIRRHDNLQIKFQDALRHIGFNVKLKPYIQRSDGSSKGDWDVGIVIDMLDIVTYVDIVVLLSGDGDFDLLIEKVSQGYGKKTFVFGVPSLTANSLVNSADYFIPIEEDMLL